MGDDSDTASIQSEETLPPKEPFNTDNRHDEDDSDKEADTKQQNGGPHVSAEVDVQAKGTLPAGIELTKLDDKDPGNGDKPKIKTRMTISFLRFYRFANSTDVLFILLALLLSFIQGLALPVVLFFFGNVTDAFINVGQGLMENDTMSGMSINLPTETIAEFSVYYAILGIAVMVIAYLQNMLWNTTAERQIHRIRLHFYRSILRQEIAWFDKHKAGELTNRLSEDIEKIRDGLGEKIGMIVQYTSTFVGGIVLGLTKSVKLTLVILSVAVILMVPVINISVRLIRKMTQGALDSYAKAGGIAEEVLSSIRTVVAFGGEQKEVERYTKNLYGAKKQTIKKETIGASLGGFFYFNFYASYALAFWYGSTLFLSSELTPGDIIVCFLAILIGSFSLGQVFPYLTDYMTAKSAAVTIWQIIDQVPDIDNASDLGLQPDELIGNIEFENIHFFYPSRPEAKVLSGLNLKIKRGQTVALVGSSGCGKSTTVQLVQRFYDPDLGCVKLDDVDLRDLNVRWLREHIGVVSQEPVLFATTIAENIRYGNVEASMEDIRAAAMEANAHDFISALPEGYETLVGDRGTQLSGGQKQRVAIARALVRNPKILLLDEATSALDTESEGTVQAALDKVQAGRTTLVVAHRLSTIQNADVICAFRDGAIVETGSHEELMANTDGVYYGLVQMQARKEQKPIDAVEDMDEDKEKRLDDERTAEKIPLSSPKMKMSESSSGPNINRGMSAISTSAEDQAKVTDNEMEVEEVLKHFSFTRVLRLNSPETLYIIVGLVCSTFSGGVQPTFAVIFSKILETFALRDDDMIRARVTFFCLLLFGLAVVAYFANLFGGMTLSKSGSELTLRLRSLAFKAMLRQEIAYFDDPKNSSGTLSTRLATETSLISGVTGERFSVIVQAFSNIGVGIIIAFIYGWQLTLLVLGFLPLIAVSGLLQWKFYKGLSVSKKHSQESIGKIVTETIENIRTVAGLTVEPSFYQNYERLLLTPYKKSLRAAHMSGLAYSVSTCVIFFAYSASFRLGGWLVSEGKMEFQNVFLVFSAIIFGGTGLGRVLSSAPDYGKAKLAAAHLFQLLDRQPLIDTYSDKGSQPEDFNSEVSFEDVHFRYPTRPDVLVLHGLTVSVRPGETLALVGSSGCGKSTSISLVERFYEPLSGQVKLDNYNINELNTRWLRAQIGLVSQEPVLFDCTIAINIAYGDNQRQVTMEEIIAAAKKANIHDFIASLPEGYETRVGDKGTQLSGGQKQRVAIARALVRNPKILLLDEATSALDTESEKIVQAALDEAKKGRTCITIAHRLSTIHDAEKIAVVHHRRVTEVGQHDDLMAQEGHYYKLYTAQTM